MDVEFRNRELRHLAERADYLGKYPPEVIRAYRRRIQLIRSAASELDIYAMRSNHYEKLKGNRSHQKSIRLNDQWRLIVETVAGSRKDTIRVVDIEDYH